MCLLLLAYKSHPDFPLIIAANRDEYYERPALAADFWTDYSQILAGRDLRAGGTWLGVTKQGRIAAVTNYHEEVLRPAAPVSRGVLVSEFLNSERSPEEHLNYVLGRGDDCLGFTLLFGTVEKLFCFSNRGDPAVQIEEGIHGLSNHSLNDNSFKVKEGRGALKETLSSPDNELHRKLFSLLMDKTHDPRFAGNPLSRENICSSRFVSGREFGTRCSTVILINKEGALDFYEKSFSSDGLEAGTAEHSFLIGN